MGLSSAKPRAALGRSWTLRLKGESAPKPPLDVREIAARKRARSVRAGFVFGVVLGAIFVALVLAPWAASVAMKSRTLTEPAGAGRSSEP